MTIKQYGGVFGRNPTFNNVTVDGTLTVDQIVEKTGAAGITLDGVTLKDGNVVLSNGKGIDFSATSGTGTSELFDDYEEGTWTPVISDGTNNATMSISTGGTYTKIGNTVFFRARAQVTSLGSVSGPVRITGLPFTVAVDNSNYGGGSPTGFGLNITAGQSLMQLCIIGDTYISLYLTDSTSGVSALDATELSATGDIYISGQYQV